MANHTPIGPMIDGIRRIMRTRGYSPRTEDSYLRWIERFLRFHDRPHWKTLLGVHAEDFLDHLANEACLAANSRNQAASALAFLYGQILGSDAMKNFPRARGPETVPLVFSHPEAMKVLRELSGKYHLISSLMYGAGLRVSEASSLRVKDLDFDLDQIAVRGGKGAKDRIVPLPYRSRESLKRQRAKVEHVRRRDSRDGAGWVSLPGALHRKDPQAGYSLTWQFLFPASRMGKDPATGRRGRWHLHVSAVQREVKTAVRASGILKNASCHTFRHTFATELLRDGVDVRTVQKLMGHKDIRTTMIYLHAIDQIGLGVRSPLDRPDGAKRLRRDEVRDRD